jgi:hypothetical protein
MNPILSHLKLSTYPLNEVGTVRLVLNSISFLIVKKEHRAKAQLFSVTF